MKKTGKKKVNKQKKPTVAWYKQCTASMSGMGRFQNNLKNLEDFDGDIFATISPDGTIKALQTNIDTNTGV